MNSMTDEDWDLIDKSSRTLIKQFLLTRKNTLSVEDTHGNCCYDLLWTKKDGTKVAVEIKDRTFASDKYGDVFAEDIKQECTLRRIDKGEFDGAIAINVFTDNIFAAAQLDDPKAKHFKRWCPETSLVKGASHEYVLKDCLSLPLKVRIRFSFDNGYHFSVIK